MSNAFVMTVAIALVLAPVTRADTTVYVSQSAPSPTYAELATGYLGQTGSRGNPFGSIQAAYHHLYQRSGNHTIRLLHDGGAGTYGGASIGWNEFNNGNGYLRMVSNNVFPSADPSWTTVKLVSDDPSKRVTLRMSYPTGPNAIDGITSPLEGTNAYPAAYEKEVVNPGTSKDKRAAENRGEVIRGLWNPGTQMALPGMIVEDLDIVLGGGHVLVGTTASTGGIQQQFEFNNVNLFMEREMYPFPEPDGPIWGKSALFASHMSQTDLDQSYLSFNDSNIYLLNNDLTPWEGDFYVGQTWGSGGAWYKLPNDFVTGNDTSTFNYWNGTAYVEWADAPPGSIWQSGRNGGSNTLTAYQLGAAGVNDFLSLPSFVPAVSAPEFSWVGGTGTWVATGGTNWSGGPWNAAETATFTGTPGTVTVAEGGVAANNGLEFSVAGYTLTGAAVTLGGANAAANAITATSGTTTIDAPLAGSAGLTKAGAGVLVLGGANTFSGGATVSEGTLSVGADANLGDAGGGITLGGGTLEMTSGFTLGSDRTIHAVASTTSTLAVATGTVSYGGTFIGSGNLDKTGAGRMVVSNGSTGFTGLFTVSAGTLEVTGQDAFATATLRQTGGQLLLAPVGGGDVTIPDLDGSGGTITVAEDVTAVIGGDTDSTYEGQISGPGGLRKVGLGTLQLNGLHNFASSLRIAVGRLKLGLNGGLSSTPLIEIDSGSIFDVTARASTFVLGNGQRLGGQGAVLGDLEFGSGALLTLDSAAPTAPLLVASGTISFAPGFGIANIFGLDVGTAIGTYTLLDEIEGGGINFANLANVGSDNAFEIGGGKWAYFQQGSLQVVVVPEPATPLIGLGLAIVGWCLHRRTRAESGSKIC